METLLMLPDSARILLLGSKGRERYKIKRGAIMGETGKRLFIAMKISPTLRNELNSPAPGTERYFKTDDTEFLQVVSVGEEMLIGRYVKDGFPVVEIEDVSRNVRSIVKLITRGHAIGEDSVHIYAI
jgi:hypothetical protein